MQPGRPNLPTKVHYTCFDMWWFWVITCDNLDLTVEYKRHAMLSDVVGYHRCNLKFSNQGRKAQIPSHCQCYVQQGSAGLRTRRAIWFLWQWNMGAIHGDQKKTMGKRGFEAVKGIDFPRHFQSNRCLLSLPSGDQTWQRNIPYDQGLNCHTPRPRLHLTQKTHVALIRQHTFI